MAAVAVKALKYQFMIGETCATASAGSTLAVTPESTVSVWLMTSAAELPTVSHSYFANAEGREEFVGIVCLFRMHFFSLCEYDME